MNTPIRESSINIFFEIHQDLPREAPGDDSCTQRAYNAMKHLASGPNVLDVGCGPGAQTLCLARLGAAHVTAVDTHQPFLDRLAVAAGQQGYGQRIVTVNCSMLEMPFEPSTFDLIWSEGAIYIAGFENGLRLWNRFVKPGGYVAVTELSWFAPDPPEPIVRYWRECYPVMQDTVQNARSAVAAGYELIDQFNLPDTAWSHNYYAPMQARIDMLGRIYQDDEARAQLAEAQREIDMYARYGAWYGYTFFVLRKPL